MCTDSWRSLGSILPEVVETALMEAMARTGAASERAPAGPRSARGDQALRTEGKAGKASEAIPASLHREERHPERAEVTPQDGLPRVPASREKVTVYPPAPHRIEAPASAVIFSLVVECGHSVGIPERETCYEHAVRFVEGAEAARLHEMVVGLLIVEAGNPLQNIFEAVHALPQPIPLLNDGSDCGFGFHVSGTQEQNTA